MKFKKPIIIAEIGCNHKGDINIAKRMIEVAANCGAEYVKFQKETINIFLKETTTNLIRFRKLIWKNIWKHRDFLEFNMSDHYKLFKHCNKEK